MTRWIDPQPVQVPSSLRQAVGGHPLVAETLARRGILTVESASAFLDPADYLPAEPADLPDLSVAVDRLREGIRRGERIAIWGDFDADGQTSTAVLLETLRALGADVVFRVPTRQEGHGLHKAGLEGLIADGADLILTCDTGVTAGDAVIHANALGAEVIITDHHVPGDRLPPALAVVNPHRLPGGHPMGTLPGVGVAFELARALHPLVADRALDLVALGTVADVATLTGDTRYLVQRGLAALRHTNRPGLRAIYQAADLRPEGITEEHISFLLAPRLNALGRLADATSGVELLTTDDWTRARALATEVEGLNARRQWLTKQVSDAALAQLEPEPALLTDYSALLLSHPTWPAGITGIVAGRLAERFGKPTVLISAPPGELARGSGRSIPGVDLIDALTSCASLLEGYGGHAGAAGFSIQPERIHELRAALSRDIATRTETIPEPSLAIDTYVELPDLTLDLVAELNRLAPFGSGNPPLTLATRSLRILSEASMGRNTEHRRLTVEDDQDRTQTVFWWQGADRPLPQGRFDLAYSGRVSDYRGTPEIQVDWLDARELEPVPVQVRPAPAIQVRDYRSVSNPEAVLRACMTEGDVQTWAEGNGPSGVEVHTRRQLVAVPRLAIWTSPPGPHELQAGLIAAQPTEVLLFAHDPGLDERSTFLPPLAGMIRFAIRTREGVVDLEAVAAAMAQRVSAIKAGLEWLAAQGQVAILEQQDDSWRLATAKVAPAPRSVDAATLRLDALLAETAAYRDYFLKAPATTLVT